MICTGCDRKFDFTQGQFREGTKIPGFSGKCYDWFCRDCGSKVAIDDTTQKEPLPAESVGTTPDDWQPGEPPEREIVPVDAYQDHPF